MVFVGKRLRSCWHAQRAHFDRGEKEKGGRGGETYQLRYLNRPLNKSGRDVMSLEDVSKGDCLELEVVTDEGGYARCDSAIERS